MATKARTRTPPEKTVPWNSRRLLPRPNNTSAAISSPQHAPAPLPAPSAAPQMTSIGLFLLCTYLFLTYSRIVEIGIIKGLPGIFLHVQLVIGGVAVIILVGSQRFMNWVSTKDGKYLLCFTGWMLVGIPFSVWRSHSVSILLNNWLESFLVFALIVGFCLTVRTIKIVVYTVGLATFCLSLSALLFGSLDSGRLYFLPVGKYSNPNDLALVLLVGLPFLWRFSIRQRGLGIRTVFGIAACALVIWIVLQTGSRGGLVALAGMLLIWFLRAPLNTKVALAAVVLLLVPCALVLMPNSVRARYATLVESEEDLDSGERQVEYAVSSQENRLFLFQKSLLFTARRPVLGGGAGNFTVMLMHEMEDLHITGAHRESHNTYTQISSELGIPALVFFLLALGCNIRRLRRAIRDSVIDRPLGVAILVSLIGWSISAVFNSIAYDGYAPLLLGLSLAFARATQIPGNAAGQSLPR